MRIFYFFIVLVWLGIPYELWAKKCPEGTYLVQGHSRQAYYRSDGTYVSSSNVSSYCRHYRGDGPLKEQFFAHIPERWPLKSEKFKSCSEKKQKLISKLLKSIPHILTNVGQLSIYCAAKSETPQNPATSSPEAKLIVLYDSSFRMDTRRIIIHELAHLLWTRLSAKERSSYFISAQWLQDSKTKSYITSRTSFSAEDGCMHPEEDFANNIEYYFVERKKFEKQFPIINSWIKKFLGDNK